MGERMLTSENVTRSGVSIAEQVVREVTRQDKLGLNPVLTYTFARILTDYPTIPLPKYDDVTGKSLEDNVKGLVRTHVRAFNSMSLENLETALNLAPYVALVHNRTSHNLSTDKGILGHLLGEIGTEYEERTDTVYSAVPNYETGKQILDAMVVPPEAFLDE